MKGWYKESYRHYLAAKGVRTARYFYRRPKPEIKLRVFRSAVEKQFDDEINRLFDKINAGSSSSSYPSEVRKKRKYVEAKRKYTKIIEQKADSGEISEGQANSMYDSLERAFSVNSSRLGYGLAPKQRMQIYTLSDEEGDKVFRRSRVGSSELVPRSEVGKLVRQENLRRGLDEKKRQIRIEADELGIPLSLKKDFEKGRLLIMDGKLGEGNEVLVGVQEKMAERAVKVAKFAESSKKDELEELAEIKPIVEKKSFVPPIGRLSKSDAAKLRSIREQAHPEEKVASMLGRISKYRGK
jgi:hypothetical protein